MLSKRGSNFKKLALVEPNWTLLVASVLANWTPLRSKMALMASLVVAKATRRRMAVNMAVVMARNLVAVIATVVAWHKIW